MSTTVLGSEDSYSSSVSRLLCPVMMVVWVAVWLCYLKGGMNRNGYITNHGPGQSQF